MVLFPPPFYFVFDISNLLSYIKNISSNELACPVMGTIFLVYIYMRTSVSNTHACECFVNEIQELRKGRLSILSGKIPVEVAVEVAYSRLLFGHQPAWNESILVYY